VANFFDWSLIPHLRRNPYNPEWRNLLWQGYFLGVFLDFVGDIPAIFCFIVILLTLWRLPLLIFDWKKGDPIKRRIYHHFAMLFVDVLDLPFWILSLFVWVTVWRAPTLVRSLRKVQTRGDIRRAIAKQFFLLILDIPAAFCALAVFITIWRARTLYQQLVWIYNTSSDEQEVPKTASVLSADDEDNPAPKQQQYISAKYISLWQWVSFVQFALFIVDLPFFLLTIFILLAPWRYYMLPHILKAPVNEWERKKLIALQALQIVLDFPAVIAVLIICCSWRCKELIRQLKSASLQDTKQNIIFNQLWQFIVDMPFFICGVFTLWRAPLLIYRCWNEYETAWERRYACLKMLWSTAKDIPISFILFVMLVTLWRIPFLYKAYKKFERGDNEHKIIMEQFVEWIIDLPFVLAGLVVLLTMWRLPCLVFEIRKDNKVWAIRKSLALMFGFVLCDIFITILAFVELLTLIRIPTTIFLYKDIKKTVRN